MKKVIIVLITLLVCVVSGCEKKHSLISYDDTIKKVSEGAVIIDVRTKEEYEEKHIDNAVFLPLDKIDEIKTLIPDKEEVIIVYCKSGNRSKQAYDELKEMGYKNIYDLGAMSNYKFDK